MRKELLAALVAVLTSAMVTIPAHAGTPAEGRASGAFIGIPGELGAQVQAEYMLSGENASEEDPGDITQDTALMNAFGGVDKYYASFERVTPEYFKQKYGEVAETLKAQIDTTSTETIISSAVTAVNAHFTCTWGELGYQSFCAFDQRMYTDYLTAGRMFNGYEPAVLFHTLLDMYGIDNDVWTFAGDSANYCVAISTGGSTKYVSFGVQTVTYDTTPINLNPIRLAEDYMGAYKDFLD
jgi:hypothetical protein